MVEALTAKNLELGERCGELEATIADLESSVELSEELEVQQAEDIRELQVSSSIDRQKDCFQRSALVLARHWLVRDELNTKAKGVLFVPRY